MVSPIIYKIGGGGRPSNSFKQRLLLKLYSLPIIHRIKWFRQLLLKEFKLPQTTSIMPGFYCSAPLLSVGEHTGLGDLFCIAYAPITIGKGCSFSFRNMIITSTHDYTDFSTVIGKPVTIGDNVWITSNVTILPGVTIGNNTVIGAGSVVTKDIPAGVFAAGNPCRVIKKIDFVKG
ncbi:DapH/DapD/GlmU-related protein [uncultured Alistipes sp.]|jgi:maltose O-acetyltransferase|uniref:acyltransferase n=1 Tax=uncultured Alistipes sp. TaxID=538949 RepID=UPI0025F5D850|nr:DapH/DapD/GlmU-related protein [uncultured Alistipes sp.]